MSGPLDHRGDRTGRSHEPLARRERQVTAQNHEARVRDTCHGQTWDIPGSDAIHLRVMWP